jgi:dipeptidyl aminopeptidase/acylaminoacyl peptidase
MKTPKSFWLILIALAFAFSAASGQAPAPKPDEKAAAKAPRPIELLDILAWRSIGGQTISPDGQWFGCRIAPQEGDGEVLFRETRGTKEYKFPAGEGRMGTVAISEDGKYGAFLIFPEAKEAKKLRKERKRLYNKAAVVNLATGEKVEYEKIKALAFSGENPGWIALHKAAPEGQDREREKWSGSDLILRELATGKETMLGNIAEFAFDKKGRWLAMIIDAYGLSGNGVAVRNMATGVVTPLDNDKANYRSLRWSKLGEALVCLKGKEDKAYEDKFHAVVGFTGFASGPPAAKGPASSAIQKAFYDPKEDKTFPQGLTISPNRPPQWTENFDALLFGIHEPRKKEEGAPAAPAPDAAAPGAASGAGPAGGEVDEDMPDLVLWHHLDKRLQSQQQVEASRDRDSSYLAEYRIAEKKFIRLADDEVRQVSAAPKGLFAIGQDNREYELDGNLDGRRFQDVYVIDLKTGVRKLALKKSRWTFMPSTDGTHFLYYDDGAFYAYEMATAKTYNMTKDTPANFINEDDDHNVQNPPDFPVGWSADGKTAFLSDGWDIWGVPVQGGPGKNITLNGRKDQIRYRSLRSLDPEDEGIDLAKPQYVSMSGEWTKKAGIGRIEKGKPGVTVLVWDDAGFGGPVKARKAEVYLYTRDTHKDYPNWYVTDATFKAGGKLTEANPRQSDFLWSDGSILLDYKMDPKSGKDVKLQAALFLPANYEKGKKYPTLVYYYEKMSQQLNRYTPPSANGFNKSVYTSNGYAVLMPDIAYKVNDPGMSAAWCVLPALEAAVASGVVDRAKVGLHGHSWGGYQTAFLVTQADFAAAVAGAPLTNMISMYSSIYFNTGGGNMAIFESSQGRFKGGYWDNLEAYQRNSPVYYAENVHTPLIILHNDKDGAVVWNQGIEYYNTLRRLKKPVIMFQYVGENHGLAKPANQKDYTVRMKEWFDHWLRGKPAPAWMTEGIPHLKMKDHLKERMKAWKVEEKKEPEKKDEKKPPEKK